ncbi:plasmid mobilization relaxosome protein MobC [Taylorella equigenitalis]|uniref:plasmid mobilization protein n=1 Tax=Taylorella equigenitalis TaxID=29575 RepID=UPI00237D1891|nr:plasmid mobilization relaxosome protein MobC [Taylorella equigenitalis]WDU48977.1 plasmid mobilization relaxosome protein MobC [Taylorella equigenitalis]WDU51452.1 plasmid mobilization relaxosome protein MobC [Taylorella equigenitalis]
MGKNNMQKSIKLNNFSEKEIEELQKIALIKTGKSSLPSLVKVLLKQELKNQNIITNNKYIGSKTNDVVKIRLTKEVKKVLEANAQIEGITVNKYIVALLNNSLVKNAPKHLTFLQRQELKQSNYQLYQIGNNINQIAKKLNSEGFTTSDEIKKWCKELVNWKEYFDLHKTKVGKLISATPIL